jgi:hypothetical protein
MLITITDEQKVNLTLQPTTQGGKPAQVDGVPTWEVTGGDATLEVAADGMSAYLISGAANTNSTIEVTADADLGEGMQEITDTIDLAVVAANASQLGLVAGTPELK